MADLSEVVLQNIDNLGEINTLILSERLKEDHQKIVGVVKSLQSLGGVSVYFLLPENNMLTQ